MNSLVLGGSGYLGSELVDQLFESGDAVICVDKIQPKNQRDGVRYITCDISSRDQIEKLFAENKIDRVFHFAGISDIGQANESFYNTILTNALSILYILDCMRLTNIKNLIFASSMYVFSDKGGTYRLSKQISEQIIAEYAETIQINYSILRFGSIYGPGSTSTNGLHQIVESALTNQKIKYEGSPESVREYIYIEDAVKACLAIANSNCNGSKYYLITGEHMLKINDVLLMIKEMLGNDLDIEYGYNHENGHYIVTPYSFRPAKAEKYRSPDLMDFSYGLWELISYVSEMTNNNSSSGGVSDGR